MSKLLLYLISQSFQKIAKFKSVWVRISVCMCMCVCACVCVCVCVRLRVYKCDKSKQCYSCHMQNTTSRITLRNVTRFQKFITWKFKKFITYTRRNTLPVWNVVASPCRLKNCIHENSHENAFLYALSFNSFMPGGYIRSYIIFWSFFLLSNCMLVIAYLNLFKQSCRFV